MFDSYVYTIIMEKFQRFTVDYKTNEYLYVWFKLLHVCLKIGVDRNNQPDLFNFKQEHTYLYSAWVIQNIEVNKLKSIYDQY